jgi:hypothetical protein
MDEDFENLSLEDFAECSILPMQCVDEGNQLIEVIICDSISGGKEYKGDMPKFLGLVKKTKDGKVIYQRYAQIGKGF